MFVACLAAEGGHHPTTEDKPTHMTDSHLTHDKLPVVRERRDLEVEKPAPIELEPVEKDVDELNDDMKTAETFWWKYYGHHGGLYKTIPVSNFHPNVQYPIYPYPVFPHYYKKW